MFQTPAHLTKAFCDARRVTSSIVSLSLSIVLRIATRFWAPTDVFILLHVCAFFYLFPHTSFYTFHIYASLFFFSSLWFLPFFSLQFSFIPIFTRTSFIALNFILLRFIGRDYLLVCFSFHSSQSSRNVWLLTTHISRYSPRVVVIMLILFTLRWCPLKVISNEISVFLSIDS